VVSTTVVEDIPHCDFRAKQACLTVGRTAVRDTVPRERGALAQKPPVLLWLIVDVYYPSLNTTGARSRMQAALISNVSVPRFTIGLIPIDHPKAVNVRRTLDIPTSVRSLENDTFDLDRHIHARIHFSPVVRNVLQHSMVLAFSVGATIRCWRELVPECALGNTESIDSQVPRLVQEEESHGLGQDDEEEDRTTGITPFRDRSGAGR